MSRALNLYQLADHLVYSGIPPTQQDELSDSDTLDDNEAKEENARDFYNFELAFPVASGANGQLNIHAARREVQSNDEYYTEQPDDESWIMVQNEVENEVLQLMSKV
jgi:hypothetical protein